MSEEEIISRIHDLIHTCDIGLETHGEYDDLFALDKEALQGLLDLYNKEKEKNKELEEFKTEHKIMKKILVENRLWEKLLNDDEFIEHLEE